MNDRPELDLGYMDTETGQTILDTVNASTNEHGLCVSLGTSPCGCRVIITSDKPHHDTSLIAHLALQAMADHINAFTLPL